MKLFCELRFSVVVFRELKIRFKLPKTATWWFLAGRIEIIPDSASAPSNPTPSLPPTNPTPVKKQQLAGLIH